MAARKRLTQFGAESCLRLSKVRRVAAVSAVKKVQSAGFSVYSYSSLASTSSSNRFDYRHISQLVKSNGKRIYVVDTLTTLIEMTQETNLSKFKSEVQNSQDHHFTLLQCETEKLRHDIEKMRGELRYEMDKVTAGQRLDLNLERGRIRDELANQSAETSNLTNKLDGEIHALRAWFLYPP